MGWKGGKNERENKRGGPRSVPALDDTAFRRRGAGTGCGGRAGTSPPPRSPLGEKRKKPRDGPIGIAPASRHGMSGSSVESGPGRLVEPALRLCAGPVTRVLFGSRTRR
ncbi:hypothetical protein NL676_009449 [Syzygium grande]|nr:hypothetical protein NL676_009449 [Syzygium grande]